MSGYIGSRASVVSSGAEQRFTFAITTTTTTLSPLSYTPGFENVFHNGVRLSRSTDYTATNGTSITLNTAAQNGDEVVVVTTGTFQVSDTYTKAEADAAFLTQSEADALFVTPTELLTTLNASGSAPVYAARAWVNFNGTGTVAIRASGNVSSITDNGVGAYQVNFTTDMPDANYSAVIVACNSGIQNFSYGGGIVPDGAANQTVSWVRTAYAAFGTVSAYAGQTTDAVIVGVAIFR